MFNIPLFSKGSGWDKSKKALEDAQVDVLNGVLTVRAPNVRKREALGRTLLLRLPWTLKLQLVVITHTHRVVFVVRAGVGLEDVHAFRAESEKVCAKQAEVGYESDGEDEDKRGRTRRDDDGGG